MNANPKKQRRLVKNAKILIGRADLPPVLRERQSVMVLGQARLAGNVVPLPQSGSGDPVAELISRAAPEAC